MCNVDRRFFCFLEQLLTRRFLTGAAENTNQSRHPCISRSKLISKRNGNIFLLYVVALGLASARLVACLVAMAQLSTMVPSHSASNSKFNPRETPESANFGKLDETHLFRSRLKQISPETRAIRHRQKVLMGWLSSPYAPTWSYQKYSESKSKTGTLKIYFFVP